MPQLFEQAQQAASQDVDFVETSAGTENFAPALGRAISAAVAPHEGPHLFRSSTARLISVSSEIGLPDEVECPHCAGSGTTGLMGDLCAFCGGSCVVNAARAEEYDPEDLDEVECPHCSGRGMTGLAGDVCAFCRGSCVVTHGRAAAYADAAPAVAKVRSGEGGRRSEPVFHEPAAKRSFTAFHDLLNSDSDVGLIKGADRRLPINSSSDHMSPSLLSAHSRYIRGLGPGLSLTRLTWSATLG